MWCVAVTDREPINMAILHLVESGDLQKLHSNSASCSSNFYYYYYHYY